jgi:hypothetical protein
MFCEDTVWEGSNVDARSEVSNVPTRKAKDLMNIMLLDYEGRYSAKNFFFVLQQFTRRRLTEDSDALNAVSSIIQWRSKNEDEKCQCLFGMPEKQFGAALRWMPKEGHMLGPLSRRKMFPSWSWAGWKGPVVWELHHRRNMIRVTDWGPSGIIETTKLDEDLYKKTGQIISPVRQHPQPGQPKLSLPTETGILQFWTSAALIPVGRTNTRDYRHNDPPTFNMMRSNGVPFGPPTYKERSDGVHFRSSIYCLQCDPYWRSKQPDQLEFIVIAASRLERPDPAMHSGHPTGPCGTPLIIAKEEGRPIDNYDRYERMYTHWKPHMPDRVALDLMCIQWGDGIAERVQVCHSWLLDDWLEMKPIEKFIKLR